VPGGPGTYLNPADPDVLVPGAAGVRERVSGPQHPDTLTASEGLACWTGEAGNPAAARDQYAALLAGA
jgi:hypothetical protein